MAKLASAATMQCLPILIPKKDGSTYEALREAAAEAFGNDISSPVEVVRNYGTPRDAMYFLVGNLAKNAAGLIKFEHLIKDL